MEEIKNETNVNEELDETKVFTALNDSALAVLWSLYQLVGSPLLVVLKKMEKYSTFNQFLAAAADTLPDEFYPEFKHNKDATEK